MPKKKQKPIESPMEMPPAVDPEARQAQLVYLAERCAEQQLKDGTASAMVIVHYLRLATDRDRLERENLELQQELIKAKTEAYKNEQASKEMYEAAIAAMRSYRGADDNA